MTRVLSREEAIRWPPDRPLKVVAGAGTGKTRFLVDRFVCLVKEGRVPPDRILSLTFTRKAAQELEERLRERLGDVAEYAALHVSTFDSFWLQILLEHPAESGVEQPVNILDEGLSALLQRRVVREIAQGCPELSLASFKHMNLVDLTRAVAAAHRVIDSARLRLVGREQLAAVLEQLRESVFLNDSNRDLALETIRFIEGVAKVEERLSADTGALDHGHILVQAHQLLAQDTAIQDRFKKRFRHILIDEAQDTNFGQFALIKFVAADEFSNVTVVGDARQSIFGFRDADPQSLQDYQAPVCNLGENFRSYQAMLDLAVETLRRWNPNESHSLIAHRGDPDRPSVIGFVAASQKEENEILCTLIRHAMSNGIPPSDIAILARARSALVDLEDMLRLRNIPTVSLVGGFYRRPEVLDARAYLAHLLDADDRGALVRILERSPQSLSLAEICDVVGENKERRFSDPVEIPPLEAKVHRLSELRDEIQKEGVSLALRWFSYLERADYFSTLASQAECERLRAQANLRKLFELAHTLTMPPVSLSDEDVLSYIDFNIEVGEGEVEASYDGADGVVLTTIHRAKGLEFPIVIYCGVHDKAVRHPSDFFVHLRSRYASGNWRYEGTGLLLAEDFAVARRAASPDEAYKEEAKGEEKRLDYVALTRAKDLQVVSAHTKAGRRLPQIFQILEEFAGHSPEKYYFSSDPDADTLAGFLPVLAPEESPGLVVPARTPERHWVSTERPVLRWSFSDFEREYCRQQGIATMIPSGADASASEDAMLRGTIIHEAIRLAGEMDDWQPVLRAWHNSSRFTTSEVQDWQNTIRRSLWQGAHAFSEHPFELVLDAPDFSLWLRGVIDRLEIRDGKGRLVDFKTGRWSDEAAARAERQLNFYAMAWQKGLWPEIKELALSIVHLDATRVIDMPLDPHFEKTIVETARNTLRLNHNLRAE